MKANLRCIFIAFLVFVMMASPVYAWLYRAQYSVVSGNDTSFVMLAVVANSSNQWMADNGFMNADAMDTRVATLSEVVRPHMVRENYTMTAIPVPANSQTNLYYYTGESNLTSMDIIAGYGGYVTRADHADLELGNNGTVAFGGWVDTTAVGSNVCRKGNAFRIYINATGEIAVYVDDRVPTSHKDFSNDWSNEANAYDENVGTYAIHYGVDPVGWSPYLGINRTASECTAIRYRVGGETANIDEVDLDVWNTVTTDWVGIYQGAFTQDVWLENETLVTDPINCVRIRLYNSHGSTNYDGYIYEVEFIVAPMVSAQNITSAEIDGFVAMNGTDISISIDGDEKDSASLGSRSVEDNSNSYVFMDGNSMPYAGYLNLTVDGTQQLWYQPNDIISGTTLPDRQGTAQNGVITWGSNPVGINATLGGMVSSSQPDIGTTTVEVPRDVLPEVGVSDWFGDGTVTKTATLNNPFRPFVTMLSDNSEISEIQAWRLLGMALLFLVTVGTAMSVRGHQGITVIVSAATMIGLVAFDNNIFPLYLVVLAIGMFIGGLVMERSPSL